MSLMPFLWLLLERWVLIPLRVVWFQRHASLRKERVVKLDSVVTSGGKASLPEQLPGE